MKYFQHDEIGVTIFEKSQWKTLQCRYYLLKLKVTQLADVKFYILASRLPQLHIYNFSTHRSMFGTLVALVESDIRRRRRSLLLA